MGVKIKFSIILCALSFMLTAQNSIKLTRWVDKLSIPVDIAHAGDDRLFVIEKAGKIKIIQNNKLLDTAFLDIVARVNSRENEQGLLGLAFHPNFKNNGWFYVNYINKKTPYQTVISRFQLTKNNTNLADSNSEKIILIQTQPYANHNGGCLKFGKDGYLYCGFGDGGSANDPQGNGQKKKTFLAKMLRIDVNQDSGYVIPPSNPFINDTSWFPEIWATGLRNPWRFSFDGVTGDMWIGDVGQGTWEEVDFEEAGSVGGKNYGWRCWEGNHVFDNNCANNGGFTFPVYEYLSDQIEGCSVTGGFVYRGMKIPYLNGKYIYGDYCTGKIWAISRDTVTKFTNKLIYPFSANQISTFGEDANGELYVAAIQQGAIYKIEDTCKWNATEIITDPSCFNSKDGSIKLTLADSNFLYTWSTTSHQTEINKLTAGNYSVTITNGICRLEKNFVLKNPKQDSTCLTPIFRNEACVGDSLLLIACDEQKAKEYHWYRDNMLIPALTTKRAYFKDSGKYSILFIDSTDCPSARTLEFDLLFHPLPSQPAINVSHDTLWATSGFSSYRWFKDGKLFGGSLSNYLLLKSSGAYCVSVIDSNTCESPKSDSIYYIQISNKDFFNSKKIYLYPNPVRDQLVLYSDQILYASIISSVHILQTDGQIIHLPAFSISNESMIFDVSSFQPGIYILELGSQEKQYFRWIKI